MTVTVRVTKDSRKKNPRRRGGHDYAMSRKLKAEKDRINAMMRKGEDDKWAGALLFVGLVGFAACVVIGIVCHMLVIKLKIARDEILRLRSSRQCTGSNEDYEDDINYLDDVLQMQ